MEIFAESYPTSGVEYGPFGLKTGTYYIKILLDSGYGGYNLTTIHNAQAIANDVEPNDTFPESKPAPLNGTVTGHLGYTGGGNATTDAVDIFNIVPIADGQLKLKIVYDSTLSISGYFSGLRIFDTNGMEIFAESYPTSGVEYGPFGLKTGIYYIKILRNSGYGGYTLTTGHNAQTIPNDVEPNDTFPESKSAPLNGTVTGHLGYTGGGNGTTDAVDIFNFAPISDGQLKLKIVYDSTLSISGHFSGLRIFDANGTEIFSVVSPTSGVEYGPFELQTGTYYTKILRNSGYGGYILTTTFTSVAPAEITVTSPNGSESWAAGSAHLVTWTSAGISGNVTIELYKGGSFNSTIGTADVAAGTYSWTVPSAQAAGTDYKVRISQGAVEDFSDGNFTITAGTAVWSANQRLTWTPGSSSSPKAAVDTSGNVHLVWYDNTPGNYEVYYRKGTNGGTTWASAKRLTSTSGASQRPVVAVSPSGHLHVIWWDETPGNAEVYYGKSTDGGTTWEAAKRLAWTAGQSSYPSLAVYSSGTVHAVWQDNTPGNYEIYYRKSADGGATWGTAKRLTWTSGSSGRPGVAVSSSGHIHLVWQDDTPGKAEIYYKKSSDGGTTWTANKRLTWTSGHSNYPSVVVDGSGNPHVVWQDETPGNNEVYYRKSADGGSTWAASQRLTWNSGSSQEPWIAVDTSGHLGLVWTDNTPGNFEVYHRESTNGGATWTASQKLSSTSGYSYGPIINAGSAGSLHVFWYDGTPGNSEIYYKKRQ
jgi:hypothetical protein